MTPQFLAWLQGRIAAGDADAFYHTTEWRTLADKVQAMDRHECQLCKLRGRYAKAQLVHHVNHLRRRPDLALDITYTDSEGKEQRNLVSVCRWCHENVCHPGRRNRRKKPGGFTQPERWE